MLVLTFYFKKLFTFCYFIEPRGRERVHRQGLDTKHEINKLAVSIIRLNRLTLRELEALASLGTSGFLTLNDTGVAGDEAFDAEGVLVFGVNLY